MCYCTITVALIAIATKKRKQKSLICSIYLLKNSPSLCFFSAIKLPKMSFRPFGVGLGIALLGTLWTLCLLVWVAGVRKHGLRASLVHPLVASVLTIGLMIWPREVCPNGQRQQTNEAAVNVNNTSSSRSYSAHIASNMEQIDWLAIPRIVFAICLLFLAFFAISRHLRAALLNRAPLPPTTIKKWHNR